MNQETISMGRVAKLLLLTLFSISAQGQAEESKLKVTKPSQTASVTEKLEPEPKKKLNYNVGVGGQSLSVYRGALLSDAGGISPSLSLKYGGFSFSGLAFNYNVSWEVLNLTLGANYFNDHMMSSKQSFRRGRPETYESWALFNIPYAKSQGRLFAGVNADMRANWSQYLSAGSSYTLAKHYTLAVAFGGAPVAMNRYVYGDGAVGGIGNADPSFTYSNAILPWKGVLAASITRSYILQNENRRASRVRDTDKPVVVSLGASWVL
jgi:hypothetical protein